MHCVNGMNAVARHHPLGMRKAGVLGSKFCSDQPRGIIITSSGSPTGLFASKFFVR